MKLLELLKPPHFLGNHDCMYQGDILIMCLFPKNYSKVECEI